LFAVVLRVIHYFQKNVVASFWSRPLLVTTVAFDLLAAGRLFHVLPSPSHFGVEDREKVVGRNNCKRISSLAKAKQEVLQ
jgi:hypothetical protein